jgi:hypothetical protein
MRINDIIKSVTYEHEATLSRDAVTTFYMCVSGGVTMRFDPPDPESPFKGGTNPYNDRLKAR